MDGPINYIDIKAKCRHLKKIICKRDFAAGVLITVYRLEMQTVLLVFSTLLCELFPLYNLLSGTISLLTPFPM